MLTLVLKDAERFHTPPLPVSCGCFVVSFLFSSLGSQCDLRFVRGGQICRAGQQPYSQLKSMWRVPMHGKERILENPLLLC